MTFITSIRSSALVLAVVLAVILAVPALAAPPPLAADTLPPGVWNLVGVGDGPNPWPGATVQLGVANDGTTLIVDAGCTRFMASATRSRTGVALGASPRSSFTCDGDRAAADAVVLAVLDTVEQIDVVAGRLWVRGGGPLLVYAPDAPPTDPGVAGAPPVASSDRLDPSRFRPIIDEAAANGAAWVRDPLQVAMLFASMPSTSRTVIVREDVAGGDATLVRLWFDDLADASVRGRWFELTLAQSASGTGPWTIVAGRQASVCAAGGALVAGTCP